MIYPHNAVKWVTFIFTITLTWLFLLVSACQATAQETFPLPQRLAVIPTNLWPSQIVVNPGGYAYVFVQGATDGEIAVFDGPTLVAMMPWPEVTNREENNHANLALHPVTGELYVIGSSGNLHVISNTTLITSVANVGYFPRGITINADNHYVYVTNLQPRGWSDDKPGTRSTVTIISNTTIITEVTIGYVPNVIVANAYDGRVYVGQDTGYPFVDTGLVGMLGIIENTEVITNTSFGPLVEGISLNDIAINQRNGDMYMLKGRYPVLYWDQEHLPVPVDLDLSNYGNGSLFNLAVDAKRNLAYATYWGEHGSMVAVIEGSKMITQLPVDEDPRQIAVDTVRDYVYVTNRLAGTMTVIRGTEVITTLATGGSGGTYIAVDEKRGYIYVSNSNTDNITVFGFPEEQEQPQPWRRFFPFIRG